MYPWPIIGELQTPLEAHATVSTAKLDPVGRSVIKQDNGDALANTSQLDSPAEDL